LIVESWRKSCACSFFFFFSSLFFRKH
jgi:hypothetical protein